MPTRPCIPTASLLVLETGATFPFEATGYRGTSDTAILVQQRGESVTSLSHRIHHAAAELRQSGVRLETVAFIVAAQGSAPPNPRRQTVLALLDVLDDGQSLLLVGDHASPGLQHELISLVGRLFEEDNVRQSIAIDFDATKMAKLRAARIPLLTRSRQSSESSEPCCAEAC